MQAKKILFGILLMITMSGCLQQLPDGTFKSPDYWTRVTHGSHVYIYSGEQGGIAHDPDCPCFLKHNENTCPFCKHIKNIKDSCDRIEQSLQESEKPEVIVQVITNTVVMTNRVYMFGNKKIVLPPNNSSIMLDAMMKQEELK